MKKLRLLDEVKIELWQTVVYYEERVQKLGIDFVSELRLALKNIRKNPEMFSARKFKVRQMLLSRFPYIVHYRIDKDAIRVYAIAHVKQYPYYWGIRLK